MPFFLIPTALVACFFLIWAFIGGMIFRDSQLAAQREREFESEITVAPMLRGPRVRAPKMRVSRSKHVGMAT